MGDWFPVPTDLFADPRVAGLSPGAFRAWMLLRCVASAAEDGGLVLVDHRRGGRDRVRINPRLERHATPVGEARIPHWRGLHELIDVGLLVRANGGYRLHDWEEWVAREARLNRERERARRNREDASVHDRSTRTVDKSRTATRGREVERDVQSLSLPLSTETTSTGDVASTHAAGETTRDGSLQRIGLAPHLQQPDGTGIRPHIRQAIRAYTNTGIRRILEDAGNETDLTTAETTAITAALGNAET